MLEIQGVSFQTDRKSAFHFVKYQLCIPIVDRQSDFPLHVRGEEEIDAVLLAHIFGVDRLIETSAEKNPFSLRKNSQQNDELTLANRVVFLSFSGRLLRLLELRSRGCYASCKFLNTSTK